MDSSLIQLLARGGIDDKYIGNDTTFFINDFNFHNKFYKQYDSEKSQIIKFDDSLNINLDYKHHFITENYIKVKIPYFQMFKNNIIVSSSDNQNQINKIIYDNHDTYLFIINSKYYLIPEFLLKSNINYDIEKIQFTTIKEYFNSTLEYLINDSEFIYFASLERINFISDILPLFLTFNDTYNKHYLQLLNNNLDDKQLNMPLLTSTTFNKYIETLIKNKMFDKYQQFNHYDNLTEFYNIISDEVKYFINYYINNHPNIIDNLDSSKADNYYNFNNYTSDLNTYIENTIVKNSLILHYILNNLYTTNLNTFTFYKKYLTSTVNYEYEVILTIDDIEDVNTLGGNLISRYYPIYTFKLETDTLSEFFNLPVLFKRLPFRFDTEMSFRTLNNKNGIYQVNNNVHTLTITDSVAYEEDTISISIITDNTKNEPNIENIISDNNINTEFVNNITTNLTNLDYNFNVNILLFNTFKELYFSVEQFIKTYLFNLSLTQDQIKNIFIGLKVYDDKFNKNFTEINFLTNDEFNQEFNIIENNYPDIYKINNSPQDLYNIYVLSLNDFKNEISLTSIFDDTTFIDIYFNKLVSFFYNRYVKISSLDNNIITNFNGLLYYFNIENRLYINKQFIRDSFEELFNKKSFIGYSSDVPKLNFSHNIVKENVNEFYENTNFIDNNISHCFNDFTIKNTYDFSSEYINFTFTSNKIILSNTYFNTFNYKDNLTKFSVNLINENKDLIVQEYILDDENLTLVFSTNITSQPIKLNEFINSSIPLIHLSTTNNILKNFSDYSQNNLPINHLLTTDTDLVGLQNDNTRYEVYNKDKSINKFIDLNNIYFNEEYSENNSYFMYFFKNEDKNITFKLRFILEESFDSISYSHAMSKITNLINDMSLKLNIKKDDIEFKNLIIGELNSGHIDYYFKVNKNLSINEINTKISDLSISILYYIDISSSNTISITLNSIEQIQSNSSFTKIILEKNGIGYKIKNENNTETLSVNYNDYNNIYIDIIKLPLTKNLVISNDDCIHNINLTFPFIYLDKTSTIYTSNISLFNSLNTIRNYDNNNPVKIIDITSNYLKLHVIGTIPTRTVNTSINIEIFNNSYLPNFYNYTSKSNSNISIIGDFMYQKPMIFKIYSKSNDTPLYLFYNIMNNKSSDYYENTTYHINGKSIYKIHEIDSNQINRDTSTNIIYSTVFDKYTLKQNNSTILNDMLTIYDNIFNNDFKSKIIDVIEKSYLKYIDSHKTILDTLKKTDNFGSTIKKVYDNIEKLNKFKTINGNLNYNLDFNNFNLFEYDYYSIYAFTLYNHSNSNTEIKNDKVLITNLNSKYNIIKQVINYPWVGFSIENKINKNVNEYLINFNSFIKSQIDFCKKNNVVDKIINNNLETESIDIGRESTFRSKYINNVFNYDTVNIDLNNSDIHSNYINKNIDTNTFEFKKEEEYITENTYVESYYNGNKIPLKYENNKYITKRNMDIEQSNGRISYVENKINNIDYYKNIGYIKINDNKIVFKNTFDEEYDYIVLNNKIYNYPINDKQYKFYVNGKSLSGPSKGISGYFYPLSTKSYENDHAHTFEEFPGITFYMPNNSSNHATISGVSASEPEGYFNYANINNIKFHEINGIYGNAKGLKKTTTNVSLQLIKTYLFYTKISSSVFLSNLNTSKKYLFKINNSFCYGQYNGTYVELLSINELSFNVNNEISYEEISSSDTIIFTDILNNNFNKNLLLSYTNKFTLNNFIILEVGFYNYYCNQNETFNTFTSTLVDFTGIDNDYPQNYNIQKNILGKTLFNYNRTESNLNLNAYKTSETLLPPIKVSNNILVYDTTDELNWLQNGGYLKINNTDYNISNLNNINENNGNYSCYYVKSNTIPSDEYYNDIYQKKKTFNSSIILDPFKKTLVTSKINTNINDVIEVNNRKYKIKKITDTTTNTTLNIDYLTNNIINLNIKDNSNIEYFREIIYTNEQNNFNYTYYDNSNNEIDNFVVIRTSQLTSNSIFLSKIIFSSSHSSETLNLSSSNNNVSIEKIDNLTYNLNLLNFNEIINGKEYITYLNINNNNKNQLIIFRFIISDTYFNDNLIFDASKLTEPLYLSTGSIKNIDLPSGYKFSNFDSFYFTKSSDTRLSTNTTNTYSNFNIYGNKFLQFDEISNDSIIIDNNNNKKKLIKGEFNNWEYIDNLTITTIDENSTLENDILLSYFNNKYLPILLVSKDIVYFREIVDIVDNKLKLSEKVDFTEADIYIYPYLPIYIDVNLNLEYFNQVYHIYSDNSDGMVLERNEIIKFGTNILQIMSYSIIEQAYICKLLSKTFTYFDGTGYYSFGKVNNYFDKNKYLKSNKNDRIFKYSSYKDMMYGDYYIEENKMKIYRGTENFSVDNVFKNINGSHELLIYYNNCFYFDSNKVILLEGMRIYNDNKQFIIKTITGNKFTFDNIDNLQLTNYTKYTFYIPNHVFTNKSLLITDYIVDSVKNGFILFENKFYTITNYKTTIQSIYGNVLVYDIDNIDIKYDFNNPYIFSSINDSFNNLNIPLCIKMKINTDDDIYLYNSLYENITFQYSYFQKILVDGVFFNVTRIESDKIYLNNNLDNFKLKIKSGYYDVVISSFNVNNTYIVSNNYQLNSSLNYNYPQINKDANINILFYNNNDTNNYTYDYSENLVSEIENNKFLYLTQSEKLNEVKNINDIWDNMNRQFYTDNYIRLSEKLYGTDLYSTYLCTEDLNLDIKNNVLIEEINGDDKFLHIVNIEIINNFMKVKDDYLFENINESIFYLHKLIPIRITKNNYIQILEPDLYELREINDNTNILNYKVFLRITFDTKPIYNKTTKLWKYNITIHSDINLEFIEYLYFDNNGGDVIELKLVNEGTTTNVDYHVTTNYLFTEFDKVSHFYYNSNNYIDKTTFSSLTNKDEYDLSNSTLQSVITDNPINFYKLLNKCTLNNTNSNYFFSILGNNSTTLNIGKIEGTFYFNNTNNIEKFELTSNNTYSLQLKKSLLDIENNITDNNYIYYKDINLNDKYYIKPRELSPSLPSMINIINDKNIDINLILNYLKPWEDWSLISLSNDIDFKQYTKNLMINYNGTSITQTEGTNSYFTNNEVKYIKTFLKNTYEYKSHYYLTLAELHSLESFLLTQIVELINSEYFWNNIDDVIKLIVKNYNSTNNWVFYNGTIMIDYGNEKEIERYPLLFDNGKRKYYLSNDIIINDINDIISISRNISKVNDNVSIFLSKSTYNLHGTSIDKVINFINNISKNRLKLSNSDNVYLNHKYPSILKFLINKQFSRFIDDDINELNNLNNDFYQIKYKNNVSDIQSGIFIDTMFNLKKFGLSTNGKIIQNNLNTLDDFYIIELNENNNIHQKEIDIKNNLDTDSIFYYKVIFDDNTNQILTSTSEYSIEYTGSDYAETDNKNNKLNISKPEIYSDSIIFYSNELIKEKDISVNVKDKYTITEFEKYGSLYEISTTFLTKITNDSDIYFNDYNKVQLQEITDTNIKLLSDKLIDSLYNLRIIDLCKIISTTNDSGITYLKLSSNISNIYITNNTYININDKNYMLFFEENKYYINDLITIKTNRLYKVTRNIDITQSQVKSLYVTDITIDKNLQQYFYYNQTDNNLDEINFTSDKLHIRDADLLTKNKIRIYYAIDNLTIGDIINHSYNVRQSKYYNIENITNQNKYLYNLDVDLSQKNKNNITLMVGSNSTEIVENKVNNLQFYLSSFISPISLNKLTINIKYTYSLQNVTNSGNILNTTIPSDFIYSSEYNYYINNTNITASIIVNNKLLITVDDITNIDLNSDITLIEERIISSGSFEIKKPIFNNLMQIDLTKNYNPKNKTINFNNYISVFDKNISGGSFNYIYYYKFVIETLNITLNEFINIVYNNKTYKLRIIMIQQEGNTYNIKVGSDNLFEINQQVVVYTDDSKNTFTVNMSIDNNNLIKSEYYKNIDNKTVQLYVNNNLSDYKLEDNTTKNDYIMYTKYSDISINNQSYKNVGFNKINEISNQVTTVTQEYIDVQFIEDIAYKFFRLIEFTINNKTIEKLDYDTLKLIFSFYYDKSIDVNNLYKIKNTGEFYEFCLILPFFFTKRPSDALPLYMLNNENIKITFHSEKLKNLIDKEQFKNYKVSKEVKPIIDYYYTYNNMDNRELINIDRKLIETMYLYQTIILNKKIEYNIINIRSRIKEFFIAIKNKVVKTTYEYDKWYSSYLTNYKNYNVNKDINIYEIEDYYIFKLIEDEIKNNSNRVIQIKNHPILKNYDLKYILFLDEKYMKYINENLNNITVPFSNKLTILSLYFKNIHKNIKIETKVDLIKNIQFELNGIGIKSESFRYYGNILPYYNGESIDDDYLLYNIGFNALEEQPTGFLCCSDDIYFGIKTTLNVDDEPVFIKILTNEYKYLIFND